MSYVIGTNLEYVKVHTENLISENKEEKIVLKVEHGLNFMENPTIFNDKEKANETLKIIIEQKEKIKFENKNILGSVIDGDELDVSKLKVYQMILFDINKDIIEQMKEMIGER